MKKERGFTLIELLGVLILLAILLTIVVPSIQKYLKKGSNDYYHNLEKILLLSGKDYLNDYRTLLPIEIGNVAVIPLEELTKNKYTEDVVDTNGKECQAKVVAKKLGKNDYEYSTCLICEGYQTEGDVCEYSEDNNITEDSKNYEVRVEDTGDYEIDDSGVYIVDQGVEFSIPKAKAYYKGKLVNSKVEPRPNSIDTSRLMTYTIKYYYKGATTEITVKVVDRVKPSIPQIVLRKEDSKGRKYIGGWYSGDIYAEYQSIDYSKREGILGSGIDHYEISSDGVSYNKLDNNYKIDKEDGKYNYYVRAVDKSGNIGDSNTYELKIDKKAPTCKLKIASGIKGNNDWYLGNVRVEFENTDGTGSKIFLTSITSNKEKINGGNITEEGIHTISGVVTDEAGNIGGCSITVKIDKTKPECSFIGESTIWTSDDRTIKAVCTDAYSQCTAETAGKTWTYINGTHKDEYLSYTIVDQAGNSNLCSKNANIYVDKEGPTTPTIGNIGSIQPDGSNPTAEIKTKGGGSTDSGEGTITYKYLIKNDSATPDKNDTRFTTSPKFTRSCGNSYYAWVIAEDSVGNRSEVKYIGTTSDGANSYSSWGSCSKTCGGGIQTRTNTCALVTSGLSQSCNTQSCRTVVISNGYLQVPSAINVNNVWIDYVAGQNDNRSHVSTSLSTLVGSSCSHQSNIACYLGSGNSIYGLNTTGYYSGGDYEDEFAPKLSFTISFPSEYYGKTANIDYQFAASARYYSPTMEISGSGSCNWSSTALNSLQTGHCSTTISSSTTITFYGSSNNGKNSSWAPSVWAGIKNLVIE